MKKFLYFPVKYINIGQLFGENKACVPITGGKVISCDGLNPPEGYKSVYGSKGHTGVDIGAYRWQPVYAGADGTVCEVSTEPSRGLGVRIMTDTPHYCKETGTYEFFRYGYWHFIALDCYQEEKVKMGDLVGYADSTGNSSGDHVHYDLAVQINGVWTKIDPLPYTENLFALEAKGLYARIKELTAILATLIADKARGKSH